MKTFITVCFSIFVYSVFGQTAEVTDFTTNSEGKVIVKYKIVGGKSSEAYKLEAQFYDISGKINAFALSGDYPEVQLEKETFELVWDALKDRQEVPRLTRVSVKVTGFRIVTTTRKDLPVNKLNSLGVNNEIQTGRNNETQTGRNSETQTGRNITNTTGQNQNNSEAKNTSKQRKPYRQPITLGWQFGAGGAMTMGELELPEGLKVKNPIFSGLGVGILMPITFFVIDVSTNAHFTELKEYDNSPEVTYRNWNYGLTINTDWLSEKRNNVIWYVGGGLSTSKNETIIDGNSYKDESQTYFGRTGLIFMLSKKSYIDFEYKHFFEEKPFGSLFFKVGFII